MTTFNPDDKYVWRAKFLGTRKTVICGQEVEIKLYSGPKAYVNGVELDPSEFVKHARPSQRGGRDNHGQLIVAKGGVVS